MKLIFRIFCTAVTLWFAGFTTLQAQANLSVQGTIQNFDGSAVDNGSYDVTFKLYSTESGGTAVWSETQSVNVVGGVYSVLLGSANPLTAAFDQTYYLGITLPGGPELTPRTRLTSSPYALSLIGQDNKFPSTGPVGAGTASPAAGYQLHVKAATGDGKLLVEGANNAKIDFKQGANTTGISYNGTSLSIPGTVSLPGTVNAGTINVTNFNPSNFSPSNMAITSRLAVGQNNVDNNYNLKVSGPSYMSGTLDIVGNRNVNEGGSTLYYVHLAAGGLLPANLVNIPVSLRASDHVVATGFWASSDRRIKKDFHLSNKSADLDILKKLQVTDYRHIDVIGKGTALKKGFIAQEVESVFPEAVTQSAEFIPSVYAISTQTRISGGRMAVSMENSHHLKIGDEVKFIMQDNSEEKSTVVEVSSANTFSVEWTGPLPEKIFVYGKKVNDFHTVDYDRIFTLNVSATQELARRVEQLEAENALLRQYNEGLQKKTEALEQQNEGLRTDLNGLGERLLKLEKQGMNRLEK